MRTLTFPLKWKKFGKELICLLSLDRLTKGQIVYKDITLHKIAEFYIQPVNELSPSLLLPNQLIFRYNCHHKFR